LDTGDCTNDSDFSILSFEVKEGDNGDLLVKLPPEDELDALIGSSKCEWLHKDRVLDADIPGMVRKSTAEALGRNPATAISIVAPSGRLTEPEPAHEGDSGCGGGSSCGGAGSAKLEW